MTQVYADLSTLRSAINIAKLVKKNIDDLIFTSTFSKDEKAREEARRLIRLAADQQGCGPTSIQALYEAMGRGEVKGVTVPAINIRVMTYDVARSIFRVAKKLKAGPILFEIARSEITYTAQRPGEYAACILAAAIKEGWNKPVFIQGDHFQVNAKKYKENPAAEVNAVKQLINEAIAAGFYNIDIDTSTLVDLSKPTLAEQQRLNYEVGVELNKHARSLEPKGITISLGGEIGEVGGKNSTTDELVAYMDGYLAALPQGMRGISKISVQTGTEHGGLVGPDGKIQQVAVDFATLAKLGKMAREKYGLGGAVQHGASTLPQSLFNKFPECEACEIHLATEFQNIIYSHTPQALRDNVYAWLAQNCQDERKSGQTDEQFYYKTRKKGFAPFKYEFWTLADEVKKPMFKELEAKFKYLFKKLGLADTAPLLDKYF